MREWLLPSLLWRRAAERLHAARPSVKMQSRNHRARLPSSLRVPGLSAIRGRTRNVNAHGNRLPNPAMHFDVSINVGIQPTGRFAASSLPLHCTRLTVARGRSKRCLLGREDNRGCLRRCASAGSFGPSRACCLCRLRARQPPAPPRPSFCPRIATLSPRRRPARPGRRPAGHNHPAGRSSARRSRRVERHPRRRRTGRAPGQGRPGPNPQPLSARRHQPDRACRHPVLLLQCQRLAHRHHHHARAAARPLCHRSGRAARNTLAGQLGLILAWDGTSGWKLAGLSVASGYLRRPRRRLVLDARPRTRQARSLERLVLLRCGPLPARCRSTSSPRPTSTSSARSRPRSRPRRRMLSAIRCPTATAPGRSTPFGLDPSLHQPDLGVAYESTGVTDPAALRTEAIAVFSAFLKAQPGIRAKLPRPLGLSCQRRKPHPSHGTAHGANTVKQRKRE